MKHVLDRLDKFIKLSGKSINKITELADLSQNTIYNWFNNKGTKSTIPALLSICTVLDIDIRDLFSDQINNTELTPNEVNLINTYKSLSEDYKKVILEVAVGLLENNKKNE